MSSPPQSPTSNRLSTLLLLFAAAVGIPLGTGFALRNFIIQHPLYAIFVLVLYEVVLLFFSFMKGIWQQLEIKWTKQTAAWIDAKVQECLSGYRKYYCQYLFYQHRNFDVKGLSTQGTFTLDLKQVFVQLSIEPTPTHQTCSNLLQIPKALDSNEHSIWDYLASEPLANQHLVIIGAPGSGKTTLLKHMILALITPKGSHHQQPSISCKLPFLLFLRSHVTALEENPAFSLADAIETYLKRWEHPVPSGWVERQLVRGRCLILLDGLDEVADPGARQQMVDWVQRQIETYGNNRFIITSRPFGYRSNPLSGVTVLEVRPFTPDQIRQFIHNWYIANEIMSSQRDDPGVRMTAKEGAENLLRRLYNNSALLALAVNPLLLTMIATVHRYRGSLPGKRVALYSEICEVFLGKRQEAKGLVMELSPAQKLRVLQPLAYHMMLKQTKVISSTKAQEVIKKPLQPVSQRMLPEAFLQHIENTSGLLLEREQGIYSFAHLTFQEYLAAAYIREKQLESTLINQIGASWWHETIRLYCAQADATSIIAACLVDDCPSVAVLKLALECQQEALEIQPNVNTQLHNLLDEGMEDANSERRHIIVEALLAQRLRQMVYINSETYKDTSLITNAEYQLFLSQQSAQGVNYQPDHWTNNHFPQGQERNPILGIRPSSATAFCKWLTERETGGWCYRLPKAEECEQEIRIANLPDKLKRGVGYWIDEGKRFFWARGISQQLESLIRERFNDRTAQDRDRGHDFDHAHTLDHMLDRARDLALARNPIRNLVLNLDAIHEQIHQLDLILARTPNLAQAFAGKLDASLATSLTQILTPDRVLPLTLDRAFISALNYVLTNNSIHTSESNISEKESLDFLRWYIRSFAQILASYLSSPSGRQPTRHSSKKLGTDMPLNITDPFIDVYVAFTILEERIQGTLPVWEGIMVVKEQKHHTILLKEPFGYLDRPTMFALPPRDG